MCIENDLSGVRAWKDSETHHPDKLCKKLKVFYKSFLRKKKRMGGRGRGEEFGEEKLAGKQKKGERERATSKILGSDKKSWMRNFQGWG